MPLFKSIKQEDGITNAFANFNTGIERPLIQLQQIVMRSDDSPFATGQRELIAAFVSGTNACGYCAGNHNAAATEFGIDPAILSGLLEDIATANVAENMKPIFRYVKKLTLTPSKMVQADADAVFNAGWSERALYDAIVICCAFNFMNRLVDGLGISVIPETFEFGGQMLKAGYDKIFDHFDLK